MTHVITARSIAIVMIAIMFKAGRVMNTVRATKTIAMKGRTVVNAVVV